MQEVRDTEAVRYAENKQRKKRSPSSSVSTSHVNRLNSPIKRQRLAEWIKTCNPTYVVYKRLNWDPKTQAESEKMDNDITATLSMTSPPLYMTSHTLYLWPYSSVTMKTPTMCWTLYSVYMISHMVNEWLHNDCIWHDTQCMWWWFTWIDS